MDECVPLVALSPLSNFCDVGNLSFEPVVMEGDLKVFNPKTYDWLDRFCVLRRNHLFIYKTRSAPEIICGIFPLPMMLVIRCPAIHGRI